MLSKPLTEILQHMFLFMLERVLVIFQCRAFLDLFDQVDEVFIIVIRFGAGLYIPLDCLTQRLDGLTRAGSLGKLIVNLRQSYGAHGLDGNFHLSLFALQSFHFPVFGEGMLDRLAVSGLQIYQFLRKTVVRPFRVTLLLADERREASTVQFRDLRLDVE